MEQVATLELTKETPVARRQPPACVIPKGVPDFPLAKP